MIVLETDADETAARDTAEFFALLLKTKYGVDADVVHAAFREVMAAQDAANAGTGMTVDLLALFLKTRLVLRQVHQKPDADQIVERYVAALLDPNPAVRKTWPILHHDGAYNIAADLANVTGHDETPEMYEHYKVVREIWRSMYPPEQQDSVE